VLCIPYTNTETVLHCTDSIFSSNSYKHCQNKGVLRALKVNGNVAVLLV